MLRKILLILLSIGILVGGYFGYRALKHNPANNRPKPAAPVKSVYVETVQNGAIPLQITSSGMLRATRRVELTAEVTGVLVSSRFREGVAYRQGEVIFSVDNAETDANVASQRSNFYTRLLTVMPDLKLDYPEVWPKWDAYLNSIDINRDLPPLPEFSNSRERNFITASGIVTAYQTAKNLEIRSGKYTLRAPFNGVIADALVQEGGLVRQGQPLGAIASLGDYELELPVNIAYLKYLKTGQEIDLRPIEGVGSYRGEIVRINPRADVGSQSIIAYVRVVSDELREGMYLQATLSAGNIDDAYEIDRKLINTDGSVFIVVQDSLLDKSPVEPVYFKEETAIVRGLEDGTVLVSKPLPGAYTGQQVKLLSDSPKGAGL